MLRPLFLALLSVSSAQAQQTTDDASDSEPNLFARDTYRIDVLVCPLVDLVPQGDDARRDHDTGQQGTQGSTAVRAGRPYTSCVND